eukprot:7775693-Ditylum_brightwellii.AAC.1
MGKWVKTLDLSAVPLSLSSAKCDGYINQKEMLDEHQYNMIETLAHSFRDKKKPTTTTAGIVCYFDVIMFYYSHIMEFGILPPFAILDQVLNRPQRGVDSDMYKTLVSYAVMTRQDASNSDILMTGRCCSMMSSVEDADYYHIENTKDDLKAAIHNDDDSEKESLVVRNPPKVEKCVGKKGTIQFHNCTHYGHNPNRNKMSPDHHSQACSKNSLKVGECSTSSQCLGSCNDERSISNTKPKTPLHIVDASFIP